MSSSRCRSLTESDTEREKERERAKARGRDSRSSYIYRRHGDDAVYRSETGERGGNVLGARIAKLIG